ncbi:unnamed protein product [Paramecium sonneborni]|uniref:NACHT domain-containing protein n=1 Tax=Paramecium sonneborni TaxID=65129 RepID=A0A8S1RJV3_9CILI|nr:unnamed protein product [Paramecium sonneborni]
MITDVIAYRPIINKIVLFKKQPNQSVIQWNLLIENNLIKCVSYNKNEAIMSIFQDEQKLINSSELSNLLQEQSKQKFLLFSQFLLKGDLIQNINLWDYYKDFAFKNQKEKKQEDYETILASYEQEILKKLFNNLKSEKDEIIAIYSGILQSFVNYFNDSSLKQIFQDDQQALIIQFLNKYQKIITITNHTYEMSKFEVTKLYLLTPYIQQFNNKVYQTNLQDLYTKIDNFIKAQLKDFLGALLDYFLNAIEFTCSIYEASIFLETKQLKDLEKLKQIFQFDNFQNIFLNFEIQFEQFNLNLSIFKENFMKSIYNEKQVQQIKVMLQDENIINIIDYNCYGECIKQIHNRLQNEKFQKRFKLYNTKLESLEDLQSNFIDCQFNIVILQYLKLFYKIQCQYLQVTNQQFQSYLIKTDQKLEQGYKERAAQILTLQKQKISSLQCFKDDQSFQVNCKSLLAQIKNDFLIIKSESDKLSNKSLNQQLLKLLTDTQFRIYQIINQTENISEIQNIIKNYDEKLEQINKYTDPLTKNISQDLDDKNFDFYVQFQESNDKFITQTKITKKYYKQYKQLLNLQLDLIFQQYPIFRDIETTKKQNLQDDKLSMQQNQLQDQEQQSISIFIQEFKDRRDNFFSEKLKSQISNSLFNPVYQKKEQIVINLKLTNFLSFFYSMFFSSQFEQFIKGDNVNDSIWQDIKNAYKDIKENIFDLIKLKPDHKVREGLVYNLIRLQHGVQEQQITSFSCKFLSYIWVFEKDQRVRNLLKNKELIEFQKQLFSQTLDNLSGSIKDELKERMQKLENLQQQIKLEGNQQKREQYQILLKKSYDELDESLDNISEMSEAMNISLIFLKDISRDIKQIKVQIDHLQDSIDQVGDDIRKLRGKTYQELLAIRKQKILAQSKLADVDSVYVQLNTIEYDPVNGEKILYEEKESTQLLVDQWDDPKGEVNEFIWEDEIQKEREKNNLAKQALQDDQEENKQTNQAENKQKNQEENKQKEKKDVMLISGNAGSGKSKAARKIEEYLWLQQGIHSKWIPIFVSLPTLKNPKYNLFEQALESENYQFDNYQIRDFKEAIQNGKESIILILDSYDEMKQDCIQQNLLMTNKLFQDLNIYKVNRQMKVIITTRKEILNTAGYQTWFYGESISTLKEVQLQNFNEAQQNEYLNQYVVLSIKRKIKEVYEFVKSVSGQTFDLEEFLNIWSLISSQITDCIKKSEINLSDGIFQPKEEEAIIKKVKTHKTLEVLKEEQTTTLQKELLALWNVNKFKKSIQSINIQQLLTTPFMLEIIVQVLPNMARMYTGSSIIKDNLIKNYMKLQKQANMSLTAREFYQKEYQPFNRNNIQNQKKFEDEKILKEENDQEYNNYIEKTKIDKIIDNLESQNFFQNYSIVSTLNYNDDTIIFDGYKVKLNPDDINLVIMSLKMKKFTVFEFYDSFISFYHEQQIHKQRDSGKISNYQNFKYDIFQFSYSLAIDMTIRELSQINYKPQGKLDLKSNYKIEQVIDDWLKQYFDVEDEYKKLIRSCILLSAKGSSYSFTHKSIQEFYVAKYIYDLLVVLSNFNNTQNGNVNIEKNKQILLKSVFNDQKFNISTENFKNVINFIKEMLINDDSIIQKLIEIVQLSKIKTYCRSASNSIYLLKYMNVFLGSKDFNNIELANTNISGLSFFDCDLSHSKLENVEINSCNLNFADLSNVKWLNVICNEKPFLQGHKKRVTEVKFSQDGQYIVSAGEENEIKLWNAESFKYIQDLEGHTGPINSLSFSSDSSILLSGSDDLTIRKWNLKDAKDPQIKIKSEILVQLESEILQIQLSKDQKKLYVLDKKGLFQILTLQKDDLSFIDNYVFKIEKAQMELFALNPIEPIVAIAYENDEIELINYSSKQQEILKTFINHIKAEILNMLFSPDGNYLAISTGKSVLVWDIKKSTNQFISEFNFNYIELKKIQFDQNSEYLIFITGSFVFKQEIKQQKIENQEKKEICLEIATDQFGNLFAIVQEKKIIIKEVEQIIYSKDFDLQPKQLKFSSDGSKLSFFLLQEETKKSFLILDIQKQEIICTLNWNNQWQHLGISNNFEKLLILFKQLENEAIQMEGCQIMDTNTINQDNQNEEFDFEVEKFCVKANSSLVAYITFEAESIKIYDINLNKHIQDPLENDKKKVYDFQFSPSQNQLAAVYKGELVIWNLDSKPIAIKKKIFQNDLEIQSMNYSPDGTQIGLVFQESFQIYHYIRDNLFEIKDISSSKDVSFSIDNKFIGFINQNQRIMILNKDQNNQNKQLDYPNKLKLIFTQDNKAIITGGENKLTLLNSSSYQIIKESLTFINFDTITFSHNLNLICLQKDRVLELWEYSEEEFKYSGSQLYDLPIKQLCFINNGQQILILNQNSKLKLQKSNCFQKQQIFQGSFCAGAISNTGLIALADNDVIKIYDSKFQQIQTLFYERTKYLEFFGINQNQLLILLLERIIIYNCKNDEESKIYLNFSVQNEYQVNLFNDIIIFQQENVVWIWNISNYNKIQLCGYHEYINCFSILENRKYGLGIKDGQEIKIKEAFNIVFVHPCENAQIYEIIINNEQCIVLNQFRNLLVYQIDQKSTINFQDNVFGITYFKERNQIAIKTKNKIQLIEFSMNQFNIIDIFDFDNYSEQLCNLSFTKNGEAILINSRKFIHLIDISNSRKMNYQLFYFSYEELRSNHIPQQAQIFSELESSNIKHFLVTINRGSIFKIQELQNCNKTVIFFESDLKQFELSLDEKFIFFVINREGWIFNNKIYGFKTTNDYYIQINSCCKAIGGDSYIFLKNQKKIVLFQAQTASSIEIDIKIDEVTCIEFLSQQNVLVLSTVKNNIIFYDYKAKKIIGTLKGHWKTINSMAVSPNGNVLASASDDQLIKLWNINQNETQEVMQAHLNSISSLAFSQDGQILASGSLQNLQDEVPIFLWDLIDKKLVAQLNGHQCSINCLEFSNCSRFLISGDEDGVIIIWNIQYPKTAQIIYIMDELNICINSLSISPKEQNLITICNLDNIQKWNYQKIDKLKQKIIYLKIQKKPVRQINQIYNFISDEQFIYVDSTFNLTILNIQTQKSEILEKNKYIFQIIPSQVQNFILSFEKSGTFSWQKNQEKKWFKQNIYIPKSRSNFILLSPDGKFLYIIENKRKKKLDNKKSRRIQIYDMNKINSQFEKIRYEFDQKEPLQGILSLDLTLAIVIYHSEIKILDIKNRKNKKILKISLEPRNIAISDDNKYLAFCYQIPGQQNQSLKISSSIYIWEFQNQDILIPLEIPNQNLLEVENFYISRIDSNKIYAIYSDGTVRNWNIQTQQAELINLSVKIPRKAQLKFSSNFQYLITCDYTCISVWQIKNPQNYFEIISDNYFQIVFSKNDEIFTIAVAQENKNNQFEIILKNYNKQCQIQIQENIKFLIAFTNNDKGFIICSYMKIYLWKIDELLNYELIGQWQLPGLEEVMEFFGYDFQQQELTVLQMNEIKVFKLIPAMHLIDFEEITIQSTCFSPDSKYFISIEPFLNIYQIENLQPLIQNKEFTGQMIRFQSNEILVILNNKELQFINISKIDQIEEIKKITYQNQIRDIVFSLNYSFIQYKVFEDSEKIKQNNTETKYTLNQNNKLNQNFFLGIFNSTKKPLFSQNEQYFLLDNHPHNIRIINIEHIKCLSSEQCSILDKKINHGQIFYSPCGELIYLFTHNSIQILDSKTMNLMNQQDLDFEVNEIQICQNWNYFALMGLNFVKIYIFQNNKEFNIYRTIEENKNTIKCIALSPKGDLLLTGLQNQLDFTNSISLWNIKECKILCSNNQIHDQIQILKFYPNGTNFAVGLKDGSVNLFSIDIKQTNYYKKIESKKNENTQNQISQINDQYKIFCYQSFSQQSLLYAQECILSESTIMSDQKSIIEILHQKGAKG